MWQACSARSAGWTRLRLVGVQCLEQRGGKTARRPEARPGGDVRHGGDFQRAGGHIDQAHGLADDRMLDGIDGRDALQLGILDDQVRHERLVERDVDVLVDGGGDEKTRVFAVIAGQVGAAAAEGNAQG